MCPSSGFLSQPSPAQTMAPATGMCWEGMCLRGVSRAALRSAGKADGFSTAQTSVSHFCSGSAVVGSPRDSPALAGNWVKVHAHAKAGNTWMSPGQSVQGQDQPVEVAQRGQWGPQQGDTGQSLLGGRRELEMTLEQKTFKKDITRQTQ